MIKSIGIRVTPSAVYFAVISLEEEEEIEILVIDRINNPKALSIPEQLKFLRNTLCDIINQFKITNACVRIAESTAQSISVERNYIEGVIQEVFASSTIGKYYVGQISNISAKLGIVRTDFKLFSEGKKNYLDIQEWSDYSLEERESILSAISALNI